MPTSLDRLIAAALMVGLSACAAQKANPVLPADASQSPPSKAKSTATFADYVQKGDAAWAGGQYDTALYMYVMALQRSPDDALTLAKIGDIHELQGNNDIALEAFERANAADPKEPRIAERLALQYLRVAKIDEAETLFKSALAQDPTRWRALDGLAQVARVRGDLVTAIDHENQALKGAGANASLILAHRGHLDLLLGRLPEADSDLRGSLKIAATPDAYRYLAEVQVREHDNAGAYESLISVMDQASAYNQLGVVLMSVHDYRTAVGYFDKAITVSAGSNEDAVKNLSIAKERVAQGSKTARTADGNF